MAPESQPVKRQAFGILLIIAGLLLVLAGSGAQATGPVLSTAPPSDAFVADAERLPVHLLARNAQASRTQTGGRPDVLTLLSHILTIDPSTLTIPRGDSGTATARWPGFDMACLVATNPPAGATFDFDPQCSVNFSSTMTVSVGPAVTPAIYEVTIVAFDPFTETPRDSVVFTLIVPAPATDTPTPTSTPTRTRTPTPTNTVAPPPTSTYTPTATNTPTPSPTSTSTATPTSTPTTTRTATPTPTVTPFTGAISGFKFEDLNGNGIWEGDPSVPWIPGNEPPVAGWQITLTGPEEAQTTTTDENGRFQFTVSSPGTYVVTEETRAGWQATTDTRATVVVGEGTTISQILFGNRNLTRENHPDIEIREETSFQDTRVGVRDVLPVTVHNVGNADLWVNFVALDTGVHFQIVSQVSPNPIPPSGSGQFSVAYAPQKLARDAGGNLTRWEDHVRIISNDPDESTVRHRLVGGTALPGRIELSCEPIISVEGIPETMFIWVKVRATVEGEPFPGELPFTVRITDPDGNQGADNGTIPVGTGETVIGYWRNPRPAEGDYQVEATVPNQPDYFGDTTRCDFTFRFRPPPEEERPTTLTCTTREGEIPQVDFTTIDIELRDEQTGRGISGAVWPTIYLLEGADRVLYGEADLPVLTDESGRGTYQTPIMVGEGFYEVEFRYNGAQVGEVAYLPSDNRCRFEVRANLAQRISKGLVKAHVAVVELPLWAAIPAGIAAGEILGGPEGDLFWQGEEQTIPDPDEYTLAESLSATVSYLPYPSLPGIGPGSEVLVDWRFKRVTDRNEYIFASQNRERMRGFWINAGTNRPAYRVGEDIVITAELAFSDSKTLVRGRQALVHAVIESAGGPTVAPLVIMRDDGVSPDQAANDGFYTGKYTIEAQALEAERPWSVEVFASRTGMEEGPPTYFSATSSAVPASTIYLPVIMRGFDSQISTQNVPIPEHREAPLPHSATDQENVLERVAPRPGVSIDGYPDVLSSVSGQENAFDVINSNDEVTLVIYLRAAREVRNVSATLTMPDTVRGLNIAEDTYDYGDIQVGVSQMGMFELATHDTPPGIYTLNLAISGEDVTATYPLSVVVVDSSLSSSEEDILRGSFNVPGGAFPFTIHFKDQLPGRYEMRFEPTEAFRGVHRRLY